MNLTVVLKGVLCDKVTDNPIAFPEHKMHVRISTGKTDELNYKVLGEFSLGTFVTGEPKLLNIALFAGDIFAVSPDKPVPFVRFHFYEQEMDAFDYFVGLVFVDVESGDVKMRVGEDTLDEGTVFPGEYSFHEFDGAKKFLMQGNGGIYRAFITTQSSL